MLRKGIAGLTVDFETTPVLRLGFCKQVLVDNPIKKPGKTHWTKIINAKKNIRAH